MESRSYSARRVQRIKKMLLPTVIALITIPTLLCVLLGIRICSLENEIDVMLESHADRETGEMQSSQLADGTDNSTSSSEDNSSSNTQDDIEKETTTYLLHTSDKSSQNEKIINTI